MSGQLPPIEYNSDSETYWIEADPSQTSPIKTILRVFDEVQESESLDLPPLYNVIECDAISKLANGHERRPWTNSLELKCVTDQFGLSIESSDSQITVKMRPKEN
ncbi:hypothetical protein [Haloarcula amylolytica]|uniref:hypothetical protein n=1 Tax=Haloarcula amylolytica TaxID=396317 RepID=UPI003C7570B3